MSNLKRFFIAVNLPPKVKEAIANVQAEIRSKNQNFDIKWVAPRVIHLTLHFLGWADESKIDDLKNSMLQALADLPAQEVRLGHLGSFPDFKKPRVLWIALGEGSGDLLSQAHTRLKNALIKLGFDVDTRPWQAHLTLARLRTPQSIQGTKDVFVPSLKFLVKRIDLMESILHHEGPEYKILYSQPLLYPV